VRIASALGKGKALVDIFTTSTQKFHFQADTSSPGGAVSGNA